MVPAREVISIIEGIVRIQSYEGRFQEVKNFVSTLLSGGKIIQPGSEPGAKDFERNFCFAQAAKDLVKNIKENPDSEINLFLGGTSTTAVHGWISLDGEPIGAKNYDKESKVIKCWKFTRDFKFEKVF